MGGLVVVSLPLPAHLLTAVTVTPYVGRSGSGDVYGPAATVLGVLADDRRRVRAADGATVQAAGYVLLPLDAVCPPGSKVTAPDGREFKAATVERVTAGLPIDHQDVTLT